MLAVVFTVDDEAGMGRRRIGNDEVLGAPRANPDVLIPTCASVDPHKGKLAVREARQGDRGRLPTGSSSTPTRKPSGPTTTHYPLYRVGWEDADLAPGGRRSGIGGNRALIGDPAGLPGIGANLGSLARGIVETCIRSAAVLLLSPRLWDHFWFLAEHQHTGALVVLLVIVRARASRALLERLHRLLGMRERWRFS